MSDWGWGFGAVCLLAAVAVAIWSQRKSRSTMETLAAMLEKAEAGHFTESAFDESMLSALETRFAHYLSASAVSAQNVAAEKDRIKELIGDISHQTKTPIANLLLYAELLQEQELPEQAREYAAALHEQAGKLHFLIDALVKLSRLENGIIALHPQVAAVEPILYRVQRQLAPAATAKGLTLRVEPTEAAACFDEKWTTEALCNLVDNAIKYTQSGGVSLSVTPYELFVRIDVRDTGVGIPEEEQARIFARFYRGDANARQEGAGIGLYLAREILRSEKGYIKVSSTVGQGSIFSMFLPMPPQFFPNCKN